MSLFRLSLLLRRLELYGKKDVIRVALSTISTRTISTGTNGSVDTNSTVTMNKHNYTKDRKMSALELQHMHRKGEILTTLN